MLACAGLKPSGNQNHRVFKCRCACGKTVVVQGRLLKSGNSTSCGCKLKQYRKRLKGIPQCKIMPGQKWGRLTFVRWLRTNQQHAAICEFKCDCGKLLEAMLTSVRHGNTRSCGCLLRDMAQRMGQKYGSELKLPAGQSGFNRLVRQYRYQAKHRKIKFNLPESEFRTVTSSPCFYCGAEPKQVASGSFNPKTAYVYNGLDRVDNLKGYSQDNVVPCCADCNRAKRKMPQSEFIAWAKRIATRFP